MSRKGNIPGTAAKDSAIAGTTVSMPSVKRLIAWHIDAGRGNLVGIAQADVSPAPDTIESAETKPDPKARMKTGHYGVMFGIS